MEVCGSGNAGVGKKAVTVERCWRVVVLTSMQLGLWCYALALIAAVRCPWLRLFCIVVGLVMFDIAAVASVLAVALMLVIAVMAVNGFGGVGITQRFTGVGVAVLS